MKVLTRETALYALAACVICVMELRCMTRRSHTRRQKMASLGAQANAQTAVGPPPAITLAGRADARRRALGCHVPA